MSSMKRSMKKILGTMLVSALLVLAGCGGSDDAGTGALVGTPPGGGTTGGGTPGTGGTVGVPSVIVALTNSTGQSVTLVSSGSPVTARATVRNSSGVAVANTVVTFVIDTPGLGVLTPSTGTALTDSSGVATVTLASAGLSAAGAATLTASAQVGADAVEGSIGFAVGAASVTMSPLTFGVGLTALSAYGTTSVAVSVFTNGVLVTTPQTVSFTSSCASSGKAELTATVATVDGVATASYRDKGCAGSDTITASVSGITSVSGSLTVIAPTAGSIQFDSVLPATGLINLKGMGGKETALVTFKVVDSSGNPIGGKTVTFSLNTTIGGITLTPATAISDPVTGNVVVSVQAGRIATPVRVSASTVAGSTTLTTQSSKLTISTGIPDQQNMSLSASTINIEGLNYDGVTTVVTARLADHFNNPVLDDTAVYFTAEGGSIASTCTTVGGVCSATLNSQQLKPSNGRVTVLAYAIGEEGFTDSAVANGMADGLSEMFDANGNSTDMPEAFLDVNENGVRDSTEEFKDFNLDGAYSSADGLYNGVLCDPSVAPGSTPTACNLQKSIHVRRSIPIIFSSSGATITDGAGGPLSPIALNPCVDGTGPGPSTAFTVRILDVNGNAMPAGTTIVFSTNNGKLLAPTEPYVVPNTSVCRSGGVCPPSAGSPTYGDFEIVMKTDATYDKTTGICTNTESEGFFTVKVTTPKGLVTPAGVTVTD